MKKSLYKDSIKEIKKTFKRFLSILLMAFLGVGFFAVLRATSPDMQATLDNYADTSNLYDIKILSTLGLTDDDKKAIEKIDNVESVYTEYSEDVYMEIGEEDYVIKVISLNNEVNKLKLLEGQMPEDLSECVIDSRMRDFGGVKVGDYLDIREDLEEKDEDDEFSEDEEPSFKNSHIRVSGVVTSPLYMSSEREISKLGNGKSDYFIFVPNSNIKEEYYTNIYVNVKGTKDLDSLEDEYQEEVDKVKDKIEKIKETRQTARYDELIDEANEKLDDAQKELDDKKAEGQKEIDDAEKELKDAKKKLADGEKELQDGKDKFNEEITKAENEINSGYDKLHEGENTLNEKEKELNDGLKDAEAKEEELRLTLNQVVEGLETINFNIQGIKYQLSISKSSAEKAVLNENLKLLETKKVELEANQNTIMEALKQIEYGKTYGKSEIEKGRKEIEDGLSKLDSGKAELETKKKEALDEIAKNEKKLQDAKKELADGEKKLKDAKDEFEEKIEDAENKLIDARTKLNDIKNAKWYIYDRKDLSGFNDYTNNVDNIDRISIVFPIVFFVIAALISLTSMTRMVEEQRVNLGTLKALGYNNLQIANKYLLYATLATVIGGLLGMSFGFQFFPRVIIFLYEMMFIHMEPIAYFNIKFAIIGLGTMLLCNSGATLYASMKILKEVPAELMRPKAPKNGKRVFLENIKFIWNRLNFTRKVTVRNMFRYKKRFMMTIIGIAGCTALILAGFGLKDSIASVIPHQYERVFRYDMNLYLNDNLTNDEIKSYKNKLLENDKIAHVTESYLESCSIKKDGAEYGIQMIVVKDKEDFKDYIKLYDKLNDYKELEITDSDIFITEKLSELLNIKPGEKVTLIDSDKESHEIKISNVVEHYISHYIYITENKYEEIFGKEAKTNAFYISYSRDLSESEEDYLAKDLLKSSKTLSVLTVTSFRNNINNILSSLDLVVIILIVSAGLLAFVVLYNLVNVNISERIRELATLKVLGFYDKEVYDYVVREIVFLAIIGIGFGLGFGKFLTDFILTTCEIPLLRFPSYIQPISILLSAGITIIFTMIVNFMTYFSLKKIDMIESLKNVE